jgi:hypothetical protein
MLIDLLHIQPEVREQEVCPYDKSEGGIEQKKMFYQPFSCFGVGRKGDSKRNDPQGKSDEKIEEIKMLHEFIQILFQSITAKIHRSTQLRTQLG